MAQTSALILVVLVIAAVSAGPVVPAIGGLGLGVYGPHLGMGFHGMGMGLGYGYGMGVLPYAYGGLAYGGLMGYGGLGLGYGGLGLGYGMPLLGGVMGKKYYD